MSNRDDAEKVYKSYLESVKELGREADAVSERLNQTDDAKLARRYPADSRWKCAPEEHGFRRCWIESGNVRLTARLNPSTGEGTWAVEVGGFVRARGSSDEMPMPELQERAMNAYRAYSLDDAAKKFEPVAKVGKELSEFLVVVPCGPILRRCKGPDAVVVEIQLFLHMGHKLTDIEVFQVRKVEVGPGPDGKGIQLKGIT